MIIKPPEEEKDLVRYLVRTYNPSKDRIKVCKMTKIKDQSVVVRVESRAEAKKLKKAVALKDCPFPTARGTFPKMLLFGTRYEDE